MTTPHLPNAGRRGVPGALDWHRSRGVRYNGPAMRKVSIILLTLVALSFAACKKSDNENKPAVGPKHSADAVQNKLVELAGSGAKDCGRLATQELSQLQVAGDCATQAAKEKKPFYVGYDLPGMTIAVAGNSQGQLFLVQREGEPGEMKFGPCPSDLRIAPSGRVTCFAPGSMGMGGMSPHGAAQPSMPPAGTPNPHEGSTAPTKQH